MSISGALLGSALNPLSSCTPKQWYLASLAVPDFLPDSFLASCGALAPFKLCSCSQPQSSPWGLTSEARASAPSPHLPRRLSRQTSQASECWLALILCVEISLLCPLHPYCLLLLRGSEASPHHPCLSQWRGFLVCGNSSSFTALSQRGRSHPYSFVSVFSFFFCPTQVHGEFLAFWEVWGLLPAFSSCSVGVVLHVDVFLMYLWGGRWSPHLTPLPSWRSPSKYILKHHFHSSSKSPVRHIQSSIFTEKEPKFRDVD